MLLPQGSRKACKKGIPLWRDFLFV